MDFEIKWRMAEIQSLNLWLGRGYPLDPYLFGFIIETLRRSYQPRDLVVAPDEIYESIDCATFSEYTVVKAWVNQWLNYVKWYCTTALSSDVTIDSFFKAPFVTRHWKISTSDPQLVRFGLLWRLYDMVAKWRQSHKYEILTFSQE